MRAPALAAALRRVSLLRMMDDFSHGIVDSRHVVLLVTVTVLALAVATAALARARGPVPADAPAARRWPPRVAVPLVAIIALSVHLLAGRHTTRGDWTRQSLYALSERTIAIVRALPRPVDVTVFMYSSRGSERARAIDGYVHELVERIAAHAGGNFRAEFVDPDRDPQRAEAAVKRYGIGAYEMGQGAIVFASGARSKVVTWEDLIEPDVDADGEAGPAIRAWRGEAAFASALLTVTSDKTLLVCFSQGHGEPDITSLGDGGYAAFADELKREGDGVRALDSIAEAGAARLRRAGGRRARTGAAGRRPRGVDAASSTAAARCWPCWGRCFRPTAARSPTAGWRPSRPASAFAWMTAWSSIRRAPATSRGRRCGRPGRAATARIRSRRSSAVG